MTAGVRTPEKLGVKLAKLQLLRCSLERHRKKLEDLETDGLLKPEDLIFNDDVADAAKLFMTDFAKFQDLLGRCIHIAMEHVFQQNMLPIDAFANAHRIGILPMNEEQWAGSRNLRNIYDHDYFLGGEETHSALKKALELSDLLLKAHENLNTFVEKKVPISWRVSQRILEHREKQREQYLLSKRPRGIKNGRNRKNRQG